MTQEKGVSEHILKKTFVLFRRHWICFIKISAVFFIPALILNKFFWQNQMLINRIIEEFSLIVFVIVDDIINLIVFAFFLLSLVALMKAIDMADNGKNPGAVGSYRQALSIFGSYLWVKILFLFKVLCWSLLFIVPGVVFGVFYGFSGIALVTECKRGEDALIFSKDIIKPNVKKYLLHVSYMSLVLFAACVVIILNFDSLMIFCRLRGQFFLAEVIDYFEIGFVILSGIVWLIFYYYLYRELKEDARAF